MKEKFQDLLGYILMGSLKPASEKQRAKEQKEREALQAFMDGFKGKK